MKRGRAPIFVQRRTYRRRRMADAARMLPILGGVIFILPLLWASDSGPPRTTSVMVYLFLAWAALAGIASLLARRLGADDETADNDPDEAEH